MLHSSRAPNRVQTLFALVSINGPQTPQSVVQSVGFKDHGERQRLIVGLRLAEMPQQLRPAVSARLVRTDFVEGGFHFDPSCSCTILRIDIASIINSGVCLLGAGI